MNHLKKSASSLKEKFEVARSVELPPAQPITQQVSSAPAMTETRANRSAPVSKSGMVSLPFTFALDKDAFERATILTAKIGCAVEDILLLIAKRFDEQVLDLTTTNINARFGPSKRVLIKISHVTIAQVRQIKDPLNIRSDGYLLRAPVIAAMDSLAALVLQELKDRYGG
jgi:hypothetical protein